jgi:hypothetical protein
MNDTDRLAALLHEEWCDKVGHPTRGVCHDIADRLIAAGVALAATPAPLDVRGPDTSCPFCGTPGRYVTADEGTSYFQPTPAPHYTENPASAYLDGLVAGRREPATPAPLDVERLAQALTRHRDAALRPYGHCRHAGCASAIAAAYADDHA